MLKHTLGSKMLAIVEVEPRDSNSRTASNSKASDGQATREFASKKAMAMNES
jgi:hypothetical protein